MYLHDYSNSCFIAPLPIDDGAYDDGADDDDDEVSELSPVVIELMDDTIKLNR